MYVCAAALLILYPCLNQLVIFILNGLLLGLPICCTLPCVICTPISGLGIGLFAGLLNALDAGEAMGKSTSIISLSTSSSSQILPVTEATEAARW